MGIEGYYAQDKRTGLYLVLGGLQETPRIFTTLDELDRIAQEQDLELSLDVYAAFHYSTIYR